MTEEQKKKCEEIINSMTALCSLSPHLLESKSNHIVFAILLAKEVFNKDITEEEAEKNLGHGGIWIRSSLVSFIQIKNIFWETADILDTYFNEFKNNSIKEHKL